MSLRLNEPARYATLGSTLFMSLTPLVMSLASWNALTGDQKSAFEEAAEISDVYFEALQRDAEQRVIRTLSDTGGTVHHMAKKDFLIWLQLAQRTSWLEYTKTNPRTQELLVSTVQKLLEQFGAKDDLIENVNEDDTKT